MQGGTPLALLPSVQSAAGDKLEVREQQKIEKHCFAYVGEGSSAGSVTATHDIVCVCVCVCAACAVFTATIRILGMLAPV